jgi:hypothetical protein
MAAEGKPYRRLTVVGASLFLLGFAGFGCLGLDYVSAIDFVPPNLRDHLSNLVISGVLCLSTGVLLATVSVRLRWHLIAPSVAAALNFVAETFLTSDNTPDLQDFGAGVLGAVAGSLIGALIAVAGTRPIGHDSTGAAGEP